MWIIEDWMSKRIWPEVTFSSFQEARDYISEYADSVADSEADYNGICEDLYAVKVPEEEED